MQKTLKMLRLPEVMDKVGLKTSQIYAMMAEGTFPSARQITGRAVGWFEHEVDEWLLARPVMTAMAGKKGVRLVATASEIPTKP
jgi:prophage regulatory protein